MSLQGLLSSDELLHRASNLKQTSHSSSLLPGAAAAAAAEAYSSSPLALDGDKEKDGVVLKTSYASVVKNASSGDGFTKAKAEYVGLINQGATCYLNSTLQTLFMTPEFREVVFKWKFVKELHLDKDESEADCIPLQLQRLFGKMALSTSNAISTIDLTKSFGSDFGVYQQQDIQELLRILIDRLEEVMKTEVKSEKSADASPSSSSGGGNGAVENNSEIMTNLFGGLTANYIRCLDESKFESERIEPFLDLSLPFMEHQNDKPRKNLIDCFKLYLKPELLSGDNQYHVESLNKKVDAIKGMRIIKLPKILTIHLKRFMYHVDSMGNYSQKKFNDAVKFPMTIDLNRYVSRRNSSRDAALSGESAVVDEFETFLQEEMDLLSPNSSSDAGTEISGSNAAGGSDGSTGAAKPKHVFDEEEEEDNEFSKMPDLVDENKNKHPEQLEEEAEYEKKVAKFPNLKYLSRAATKEELTELISSRGEWVYELYAVIIHSGNVNGGHYYVYIKDLDSNSWSEFNDSRVSTMTEKDVTQAWGAELSSASDKIKRYRDSNAYMLMYRKVTLDVPDAAATVTLAKTKELVPEYIKQEVEVESESRRKEEADKLEAKAAKKISIRWKSSFLNVTQFKSYSTLQDLVTFVWNELRLHNEPEFADELSKWKVNNDDSGSDNGNTMGPIWDRIRLMDWTSARGTSHDLISAEKTCADLFDGRIFHVELRAADATWNVFELTTTRCTVKIWDTSTASMKNYDYNIAIPNCNFTEAEFIRKVHDYLTMRKEVSFGLDEISISIPTGKEEVCSINMASNSLNEDFISKRVTGVKDGFNVIVEQISPDLPGHFHMVSLNNQISIGVNPFEAVSFNFRADKTWTIARLKEEICLYIQSNPVKMNYNINYDYQDMKAETMQINCPYSLKLEDDTVTVKTAILDINMSKNIWIKKPSKAPEGMKPIIVHLISRPDVFKDSFIHIIPDTTGTDAVSSKDINNNSVSTVDTVTAEASPNEKEVLVEIELNDLSGKISDPIIAVAEPYEGDKGDGENIVEPDGGENLTDILTAGITINESSINSNSPPLCNSPTNDSSKEGAQFESTDSSTNIDESSESMSSAVIEPSDFATKTFQSYAISDKCLEKIDQDDVENHVCYPEAWAQQYLLRDKQIFNELRVKIFSLLSSKKRIPDDLTPRHIRCYSASTYHCAPKLLVDDVPFSRLTINSTNLDSVFVEVLSNEIMEKDILLPPAEYNKFSYSTVMRFCRKTWRVNECIQIGYSQKMSITGIQTYLAKHFNIAPDNALFTKLSYSELSKKYLYETRNMDWVKITKAPVTLNYLSFADFIIIADSSEEFGELSPPDLASIRIQEAGKDTYSFSKKNEWWNNSNSKKSSAASSVSSYPVITKKAAGGVSIKRKGENKSKPANSPVDAELSSGPSSVTVASGSSSPSKYAVSQANPTHNQGCIMMFGDDDENSNSHISTLH